MDLLRLRASEQADQIAYTFLQWDGITERHLTYAELDEQAFVPSPCNFRLPVLFKVTEPSCYIPPASSISPRFLDASMQELPLCLPIHRVIARGSTARTGLIRLLMTPKLRRS